MEAVALRNKVVKSALGWLVIFIFFFPVLWMWLEGLKTEPQAASTPPTIFFTPTLEEFQTVLSGDFPPYFINSATASLLSTLLVLVLGLPAAYALSIRPVKRARDALFFFISTRFLPFAASLVPLYLLARDLQLLDNVFALAAIYTTINLPLGVWLLRSFLLEIPHDLFEAARVDGAGFANEIVRVVVPLIGPALVSCWLFVFLLTVQSVALPLLLVGPGTELIAVTLFDLWQNGQVTELAAMGVLWTCFMLVVATGFHITTRRYQLSA